MRKKTHSEFMDMVKDFPIEILGKYIDRRTRIDVRCKKCNREWSAIAQSIYTGRGCRVCVAKEQGQKRSVSCDKYDEVKEIANKYNDRKSFAKNDHSAYAYCVRHKILDELTSHMTKKKGIWTIETITVEALKYDTRGAFQKGAGGAVKAARKLKIFDEITSHMNGTPRGFWKIKENVINESKKYKNIRSFAEGSSGACAAARKYGWVIDCFEYHSRITADEALKVALGYETVTEFMHGASNAYYRLKTDNKMDLITHFRDGTLKWTEDMLATEAMKYKTRSDMQKNSKGAWIAAWRRGILDDICSHMEYNLGSDNDCIYIWKAIDIYHNGVQVYKIGTTSSRLGMDRIDYVSLKSGFDYDVIIMKDVHNKATTYELALLDFGINPYYHGFNGASDFRALTEDELTEMLALL